MNPKMTDWFDRYLFNQMSEEEKKEFHQALNQDEHLKKCFSDYKLLIDSFKEYHYKNALDNNFNQWYLEETTGSSIKLIKRVRWAAFYIAASVALIITLSALWFYNSLKIEDKKQTEVITHLKKELKQIQHQQKTIVRSFQKIQQRNYAPANAQSTGFLIAPNYIITTYHSIQNSDSVFVENDYHPRTEAKVVYVHPSLDIALMYVPNINASTHNIHLLNKAMDLGKNIFTLGFPTSQLVYNEGYISAINGYDDDTAYYQITLPLNPGNSGGPLFDTHGNLIGMVVSKNTSMEGVAFALKSNMLYALRDSLPADSLKNVWTQAFKGASVHFKNKSVAIEKFKPLVFKVFVYQKSL